MPPRSWRLRIEDILDAIERIQGYTATMDRDSFERDLAIGDAVRYRMLVIGEATRHVPDEITDRFPGVPWTQMRGMRNVIAHGYFRVSHDILWATITHNLPAIVEPLRQILKTVPD